MSELRATKIKTAPALEPITVAEARYHLGLDDYDGEPAPGAPTVALAGGGAGNLDNAAYRYRVTFVTADGETEGGTISSAVTVVDKTSDGKMALSVIPLGGLRVTSRKIYRTEGDGSDYKLLTTIADNTTTTYTDNIADGSLGAGCPSTNDTDDPYVQTLIKTARQWAEDANGRKLISQTWYYYMDQFPAGNTIMLPFPPLQSVSSIKYYDVDSTEATFSSDDYEVDAISEPARIVLGYSQSWPSTTLRTANGVCIEFVCGFGDAASSVPTPIIQAMKLLMAHWYEHRESVTVGAGIISGEVRQSAMMLISQTKNFKG